ncbi:homogentisate 1,2-dioxygenase [Echria macrotheca]|uniref:homogentisate 1,2-dioxygenase n=1 Tax=Echria macrotheca TaxID=438768 RepID=A0AAJ0B9X0_9PEZI|nr:homogentisate 1,2-dioxygenase [Echria macrotheca]
MALANSPTNAPTAPFTGATASGAFSTTPTSTDPYTYQVGFGNYFTSEALSGAIPIGQNTPQRCPYDLISEQLNGTPFISSRAYLLHAWFYRINPSSDHGSVREITTNPDLEAVFHPSDTNIRFMPECQEWEKFPLPSNDVEVDFVDGVKTIAGHGDPTAKEGLAVHMYLANRSMEKRAFCNHDGDMLILPQEGRLDIQTEFGKLMVSPGELVVIQAAMRFSVRLPDGVGRGYIQEVFGTHYELPELGPVGSNGMAQLRDFEIPVASFDVDQSEWTVVMKLAGKLFGYEQGHTPFDVVGWHGTYAPFKYKLERFINSGTVDRDQSDPSIYCVLTTRSKIQGVSTADFLAFTPKWQVARNTFRPPYYHRNVCTEVMGMVCGKWTLSSSLEPGGLTYEPSYLPHGESQEMWKEATTAELVSERVGEGNVVFMMQIPAHVGLTKYALNCKNRKTIQKNVWNNPSFLNHLNSLATSG